MYYNYTVCEQMQVVYHYSTKQHQSSTKAMLVFLYTMYACICTIFIPGDCTLLEFLRDGTIECSPGYDAYNIRAEDTCTYNAILDSWSCNL